MCDLVEPLSIFYQYVSTSLKTTRIRFYDVPYPSLGSQILTLVSRLPVARRDPSKAIAYI